MNKKRTCLYLHISSTSQWKELGWKRHKNISEYNEIVNMNSFDIINCFLCYWLFWYSTCLNQIFAPHLFVINPIFLALLELISFIVVSATSFSAFSTSSVSFSSTTRLSEKWWRPSQKNRILLPSAHLLIRNNSALAPPSLGFFWNSN